VRIGLACVKGLAEAVGKPVVAVSNLQALAAFGTAPLRATVLDARRGEIYGAVYDADLNPVAPELVMKFPQWLESLPAGSIEFISTDFSPFRAALAGTRPPTRRSPVPAGAGWRHRGIAFAKLRQGKPSTRLKSMPLSAALTRSCYEGSLVERIPEQVHRHTQAIIHVSEYVMIRFR
jgi:tRNA threonylcarbamoyladenosine biosynthesis protein TsaB